MALGGRSKVYLGLGVGDSILSWGTIWLGGQGSCSLPRGLAPPPTTPPPDMLLLKKQTEDISSVYEIREKLGS